MRKANGWKMPSMVKAPECPQTLRETLIQHADIVNSHKIHTLIERIQAQLRVAAMAGYYDAEIPWIPPAQLAMVLNHFEAQGIRCTEDDGGVKFSWLPHAKLNT